MNVWWFCILLVIFSGPSPHLGYKLQRFICGRCSLMPAVGKQNNGFIHFILPRHIYALIHRHRPPPTAKITISAFTLTTSMSIRNILLLFAGRRCFTVPDKIKFLHRNLTIPFTVLSFCFESFAIFPPI